MPVYQIPFVIMAVSLPTLATVLLFVLVDRDCESGKREREKIPIATSG